MFNLTVYPTGNIALGAPATGFYTGLARLRAWVQGAFQRATAPRVMTRADEIEQLRVMAHDLLKTDPSLAQDLYAAADRCEYEAQRQA
ncbi:MAG: hypothetical protein RI959_101 [Pseudomonadota bacterium]|jgi:hypothetical protein